MKNLIIWAVCLASMVLVSCSDDDPFVPGPEIEEYECGTDLFRNVLFDSIVVTTEQYGSNTSVDGLPVDLFMDIYNPIYESNETRPVIIFAFGGSFVFGGRNDMESFCRAFAEKGFVTASIDYRKLNILNLPSTGIDSFLGLDITLKATSDMKASVRHLRKTIDEGNKYNIDTDKIIVGGLSAGAITALNVAILDEEDVSGFEPHIKEAFDKNGGLSGDSGDAVNLGYSDAVSGVINMSGAIYRLNWYDSDDPPIVSIQGDADETVPYGFDWVNTFGNDVIKLYGSGEIHPFIDNIGVRNSLTTVLGGGHSDIYLDESYEAIRNQFFNEEVINLFQEDLCN